MDQKQIGAFIAQLRREKSWTQEELGARLGVTNKTVSRWENGNYMPDIETLSLLSREFEVSLNELVQGRRLEGETSFRTAAEENLTSALERPTARLWRWLDRHMLTVILILLFGMVLAAVCGLYRDYKAKNPADILPPGSYSTDPWGRGGEYLVFDGQGAFWRYRQGEDFLEQGSYTVWEDKVTVAAGRGRSYQLLIKADQLYEWDEGGNLTAYTRFHDVPLFINCGPNAVPLGET